MTGRENQTTYFGQIADFYDIQQPVLYRKYDEIHNLIVQMLQFDEQTPFSAVDLGCGTGTLAKMILQAYPFANVTCIDISPEMLSIAKRKLAEFKSRTEFIVEDLGKAVFQKSYDVAVSIAAIHHLPDPRKRNLFGSLYDALTLNGVFLLADSIVIESATLKDRNARLVKERVQGLVRDGKISIESIRKRREIKEIAEKEGIERDYECTFNQLNEMLRDSGFEEVECFWRYFDDVMLIACKEKRKAAGEKEWLELISEIELERES